MLSRLRYLGLLTCVVAVGGSVWAAPESVKKVSPKDILVTEVGKKLPAEAKNMYATSAGVGLDGKTFVVLYWRKAEVEGVVGYNLYRREKSASSFPPAPVNGSKPIASVKTCAELLQIIPKDSPEYDMLSNAFSVPSVAPARIVAPSKTISPSTKVKSDAKIQKIEAESGSAYQIAKDKPTISAAATIGKLRPDLILRLSGACEAIDRGLTADEEARFDAMATANLKIRLARGLGYIDKNVVNGTNYVYELRAVASNGTEFVVQADVPVQAGQFVLPSAPTGISTAAGDGKVLVLWNRDPAACTYVVSRSTTASGTYQQVNTEPVVFDLSQDLNGDGIAPAPGLVDYQRWSEDGLPVTHEVLTTSGTTISVDGPVNYTTYYYKVAAQDILDRVGAWSTASAAVKPEDRTPPKTPGEFRVDVTKSPVGLALSWRKVRQDVAGHQELDTTQTYNIYRADTLGALDNLSALTTSSSLYAGVVTANPGDDSTPTLAWNDTTPTLVPSFGEKDTYYRIQCVDAHGNVGAPSAVVSGRAPDTKAPGPTKIIQADGYAKHIRIQWDPNTEPDLAGYQIWVSECDKGQPYRPRAQDAKDAPREPCDFKLVGELLVKDAEKRKAETGRIYFDDYSRPADSPICYSYWVRAFDLARNLYSGTGMTECPLPGESVCQRLYEETAPPPPVLSAVNARSNAVQLEWLASPIQDLRAFHIYRSETEPATPVFVGCVLTDGTILPNKWVGDKTACAEIPAEANPVAVKGSFVDKDVEPNKMLWYRVACVDWLGNESESADLTKIPAISTFTYSADVPATPAIASSSAGSGGCGLIIKWTPAYAAAKMSGFLVFRASASGGPYRQVSDVVAGNEFSDESALKGVDYWYRVQAMDKAGTLSQASAAVLCKY